MSEPFTDVPSLSGAETSSLSSGEAAAGTGMGPTLEAPAVLLLTEMPSKKQKAVCMVNSCGCELKTKYEQRYRLCSTTHMKAPQFKIDGKLYRFCQKCGKFQPLGEFEETRRSCRASLDRHNAKQRTLRLKKAEAHMAAQMAAAAALPAFFAAPRQISGAFLPPAMLAQASLAQAAAQQQVSPAAAGLNLVNLNINYLTLLQAAQQGLLTRANDAAVAAAFSAALLGANGAAAAPAVAAAPGAVHDGRPMELDNFLGDILLEPSLEVEELGLGVSDPTALPPILRLPDQQHGR